MKKQKWIAFLLCAALIMALFTACGKKNTPAVTDTDTGAGAENSNASNEKIEIVYWHTYTDQHEDALLKLINSFNSSQDKYEVVPEQQPYSEIDSKLMQAVRNNTGPDIVNLFPSDAVDYIANDLIVDLSVYINDPEIGIPDFKEQMAEGQYEEITQWGEDRIYLFPCTNVGEVLFYNKTMFDKYGLEAPKTWTDVEEYSKIILEKEGIPGFGTDSITDTYLCLIKQAGSGYIDAENKDIDIDETIGKEKLNWIADGVKDGYFRLVGEDEFFSGVFGSQAIASYIGSSAGVSYVEAAVGDAFEVGCIPIPQEGPVKYISQWANNFVCLSQTEEQARASYEFLKFFTSEEAVVDWAIAFGSVPVFKDSMESEKFQEFANSNIAVKALTEEVQYVGMLPSILGSKNVRTELDKMLQNASLGLMSTEEAFDSFMKASQKALNK